MNLDYLISIAIVLIVQGIFNLYLMKKFIDVEGRILEMHNDLLRHILKGEST